MPGISITQQQVKLYMSYRKNNSQVKSAAKAGISERSARRIETVFFKIVDTLRLNFTRPFSCLRQAHYQGSTLLHRLVHSF